MKEVYRHIASIRILYVYAPGVINCRRRSFAPTRIYRYIFFFYMRNAEEKIVTGCTAGRVSFVGFFHGVGIRVRVFSRPE